MRVVFSFSVSDPELIEQLRSFKENGGNVSKLVNLLLKNYFSSGNNPTTTSKELLKIAQLEEKIKEYEKWRTAALEELKQLKVELKKNKSENSYSHFIPLLKERFQDFDDAELTIYNLRKAGIDPEVAITRRLSILAAEAKVPLDKAKDLFFKTFPDFKEKINL